MDDIKLLHKINNILVAWVESHTPERDYICVAPDGRLLEEFAIEEAANKWATETRDFVEEEPNHDTTLD